MPQIPRTATPLEPAELAAIFCSTHPGPIPDRRMLPILAGIIGVENARGAAIIGHNWGNIMAGEGWIASGRDYWPSPVQDDPDQPKAFRVYPTHEEGARAWWQLIYSKRHRGAVAAALRHNPRAVVDSLYRSAYVVGGSKDGYRKGVADVARDWAGLFAKCPVAQAREIGGAAFVAAAFALSVGGIAAVVRWS